MDMTTKKKVLQTHLNKWLVTKKYSPERIELTNSLATTVGIRQESVARAMVRIQMNDPSKEETRGRPVVYGKNVDGALYKIWKAMDEPCGEVLHPMIETYLLSFQSNKKWKYGEQTNELLCVISLGSVKTRIAKWRKKEGGARGRSATRPSPLKDMIPIRKSHTWHTLGVGYAQLDTVVHCGDLLTGDVVYSVGCVDFRTYWAQYTAQWNKGDLATRQSIECIVDEFPFPLIEVHPDTGTEFINYVVHRCMKAAGIAMTRSEPYKKNDNMCIEERNNTIPRQHVGYARLDDQELVPLVMEILRIACIIHNHFRPVRRMVSKKRIGAKWHRTFEKVASTPYQRVMSHPDVAEEDKEALRTLHEQLDPLQLKEQLDTLKQELNKKLLKKRAGKV